MGIIDTGKLLMKAQQTKSKMSKISAAGRSKSGQTAIMLNGMNDIIDLEVEDEFFEKLTKSKLKNEILEAYKDARKELEAAISEGMDMDTIKGMFGG